jgi:cyclopropane fatty-acyl-phospholipid synthase-like methyltransferase
MSRMARLVMGRFYREAAGDPSRLPWHRETPDALLAAAVERLGPGRRALDLGCGAGVFSVWMAQRGLRVTGLDLFPEAITMASTRAKAQGVELELVAGDLVDYHAAEPFDLVFDSGCLHSLVGVGVDTYKHKLMQWLAPSGEYVLEHWGKRHMLDWRPIGPRRRSQARVERTFAPELTLLTTHVDDFAAPLPFGPTVRGVAYHFRRSSGRP